MATLPRPSAEPPHWHPAAAFDPEARQPYFSPSAWGLRLSSRTDGLPEPVQTHVRLTPEGLSLHAHCERCTERYELVLDFRSLDELCFGVKAEPTVPTAFRLERAALIECALWEESLRNWATRHLVCSAPPAAPAFRPAIEAVVEAVRLLAEQQLRERGGAESVVVAVPDQGEPRWFDCDGVGRGDRALTAFRVREVADRARLSGYAIVAAEEAPASDTTTLWRLAVLDGTDGWWAEAAVERFGSPPPARGLLRSLEWAPILDDAEWLDGLRARRRFFPLARPNPQASA